MPFLNEYEELVDSVGDRLGIIRWDLDDKDVVAGLESGLPTDGSVHVFSDEWACRGEQCAGFIRARAGLFSKRVGARSCDVREVPKIEAVGFLEAFHIQGANRLGVVYFGLYTDTGLVGLLSMGRHSRQVAKNRIVLDRLCFTSGVQVIGGASRLVKAATTWAKDRLYDEIVTFSDNRWTDGSLYESLGFELDRNLRADYCYVSDGRRVSKQSQKKSSSGCPEGMTEYEWASHRGMKRIYDAGKKRWVMNLWPGLHETRNSMSSRRCAKQHQDGLFKHSHIRGHFYSEKNGRTIYYGSSYELRCLFLLDSDTGVSSFRRCEVFRGGDGWRNPDLWVEFADGRSEVWEVKPEAMLSHQAVQDQIGESKAYAMSKGVKFRLWTEGDSGLGSDHKIIEWARKYLASIGEPQWSERKKESRRQIRKRHYAKVSRDKVEVQCGFCKTTHTQLRLTYDRNVKKNGRFICIRENGSLIGKRPKTYLKKTNPYAEDGKKRCSTCSEVKSVEVFDVQRASWDGISPRCKDCCRKKRNERKRSLVISQSMEGA